MDCRRLRSLEIFAINVNDYKSTLLSASLNTHWKCTILSCCTLPFFPKSTISRVSAKLLRQKWHPNRAFRHAQFNCQRFTSTLSMQGLWSCTNNNNSTLCASCIVYRWSCSHEYNARTPDSQQLSATSLLPLPSKVPLLPNVFWTVGGEPYRYQKYCFQRTVDTSLNPYNKHHASPPP